MIKFILEVDDSFIEEHSDPEKLKDINDGNGMMKAMLDCITMTALKAKSKNNEEIRVSTENVVDERAEKLMTDVITSLYAISLTSIKSEENGSN